jgi:hypothetical protein
MLRLALPAALMALPILMAACQPETREKAAAAPRDKAVTVPGDPCTTKPAYNPQRSKEWNDLRAQMQCAKLGAPDESEPR